MSIVFQFVVLSCDISKKLIYQYLKISRFHIKVWISEFSWSQGNPWSAFFHGKNRPELRDQHALRGSMPFDDSAPATLRLGPEGLATGVPPRADPSLLCSRLYSFIPTLLSTSFPSYQLPNTSHVLSAFCVWSHRTPTSMPWCGVIIIPTLQMVCTEAAEIK